MHPHYRVIRTDDLNQLERQVNENLKRGWTLVGGIRVVRYDTTSVRDGYTEESWQYFQSMLEP